MAISSRRPAPRTSSRLARLAQAIAISTATAASSRVKGRAHLTGDHVGQRLEPEGDASVAFRKGGLLLGGEGTDLGVGRRDVGGRRHAADHRELAVVVFQAVAVEPVPQLGGARHAEGGGHDTDDAEGVAAETDRLADHPGVALVALVPETVAEQQLGRPGSHIAALEAGADGWTDAEQVEEARRHPGDGSTLRTGVGPGVLQLARGNGEPGNRPQAAGVLGKGEVVPARQLLMPVPALGLRAPDPNQGIGIGEGQRPQEHGVHQREHGREGGDAEAEGGDGSSRPAGGPAQAAQGEADIQQASAHRVISSVGCRACRALGAPILEMLEPGADRHVFQGSPPQPGDGQAALLGRTVEAAAEGGAHVVGEAASKRSRVEAQQAPIARRCGVARGWRRAPVRALHHRAGPDQARPRACSTTSARRAISAWSTRRPRGVRP